MEGKMIYKAISDIMAEAPAIGKNKKNQQQGFMYRGVDDVMNYFQPLLAKHRVFVVPRLLDTNREERQTKSGGNLIYTIMQIEFNFYAEDGSYVSAIVQGEGMDSADKSSNKAMAIAYKYALFQVFCIPTEEMKDPDGESPENSAPKEYKCADCGTPFTEWTDSKGKKWSAGQLYHMAEKSNADGKARCKACREKHEAGMKKEGENNA